MENDIKKIWQESSLEKDIRIDGAKVVAQARDAIHKFDKNIRRRDFMEIGAAIIMIPYLLWIAFVITPTMGKIGAIGCVCGLVLVVFKIQQAKSINRDENREASLKEYLHESVIKVEKQVDLLNNVLYWYILPLYIPSLFFAIGVSKSVLYSIFYFVISTAFSAFVYFLNKRAVHTQLEPVKQKLLQAINNMEQIEPGEPGELGNS